MVTGAVFVTGLVRRLGGRLLLVITGAVFVTAWGSGFLIARLGPVAASPLTLLFWRFAPVAVVLCVVSTSTGGLRGLRPRDVGQQASIALLGQFGYCVFVYLGIARGVATGTSALIDAIQPIVIATLVGPVLGLAVRARQWLGLLVGMAGTVVVVVSQAQSVDADPIALAFPLGAVLCLIAATLIDRRHPTALSVRSAVSLHTATTACALAVVCALTGSLAPPAGGGFWLAVLVAVIGPTLLGYGLYWYLLRRLGVTALNGLLFLVLPVTAVAGAVLFGERLDVLTVVGFALCAGGVALVLVYDRPRAGVEALPV